MITLAAALLTAVSYLFPFAPSEGYVNRTEGEYRSEICLNGSWDFKPADGMDITELPDGGWDPVKIKIPSPWNVNAFGNDNLAGPDHRNYPSYPESWNSVLQAWMHRTVEIPQEWERKRLILHFEAVAGETAVYVNGKLVAENFDLFLPFEADVTDVVTPGGTADIIVAVRSQKLFEDRSTVGRRIVPAGSMWGYLINGIWQDVALIAVPEVYVEDVYVKPLVSKGVLEADVTVRNAGKSAVSLSLEGVVNRWINEAGKDVNSAPVPAWSLGSEELKLSGDRFTVPASETVTVTVSVDVPEGALAFWTPETPNLHALRFFLRRHEGRSAKVVADCKYTRFGWREWTIEGDRHCLNGEPYALRGDSWHFMGIPQMTRRYAWAWFTAIKDMNGNAVRPHAQVYPRFYLDMADEMGICVLDETANWASDGGPKLDSPLFWEHSRDHLERFVRRDRNHASVFGWSVSNENKPVILYVFKRPDLMPQQYKAWEEWRDIVRKNDCTRPWISSDGEDDGDGRLPVTVGHYGDEGSMRRWIEIGKPWGMGEHGMAYYGTPDEVARYNGDRAYESAEGRMEGIAKESWKLIAAQRNNGASYSTVFNMVWYGLQPLPLGKQDLGTEPELSDGIVFAPYREGVYGVQPERMGPYCTTLNPGYDPTLPLYRPWPMFEAMRAANAPGGPQPCRWTDAPVQKVGESHPAPSYEKVYYVGRSDSPMKLILDKLGVVLGEYNAKKFAKSSERALFLVDASEPQTLPNTGNAEVMLWGLNPQSAPSFTGVLGEPLELHSLERASFIPEQKGFMEGISNSDFYFCEVQRGPASRYTLGGRFVEQGEILLSACRTDWRKWNKRPEELKTAALLRSENECTVPLAVIARLGKVYVSTLGDFISTAKGATVLGRMLYNAGVPFTITVSGKDASDIGEELPGLLTKPVE
ncbi:MAG: glycoside hydrolase family 2 TIM barrel-domain containing protein [Bacteroidales bacterium]|nr:glycoside hydrolase family 2 TIM barrel-domain containing protein [Bacteroidales bacterium]